MSNVDHFLFSQTLVPPSSSFTEIFLLLSWLLVLVLVSGAFWSARVLLRKDTLSQGSSDGCLFCGAGYVSVCRNLSGFGGRELVQDDADSGVHDVRLHLEAANVALLYIESHSGAEYCYLQHNEIHRKQVEEA